MGVEIREKVDSAAPSSISQSGLLGWAARHGRSWSPVGVAIMFALMVASLVIAVEYTDAGKMLVKAWKANTAEVAAMRRELATESSARAKTDAKVDAILEQLRMNGNSDATTRLGRLENNDRITGQVLVELNGGALNDSFPGTLKNDFWRPPDAPVPVFPLFKTKQQWAIKPD